MLAVNKPGEGVENTSIGSLRIDYFFLDDDFCHCAPNLAYELRTSTRRLRAKFKSQTDFFLFRIIVLSTS